jgi:hypothetical protein
MVKDAMNRFLAAPEPYSLAPETVWARVELKSPRLVRHVVI